MEGAVEGLPDQRPRVYPWRAFLQARASEPVVTVVPAFHSPLSSGFRLHPDAYPSPAVGAKNDSKSGKCLRVDDVAEMERFRNPYGEPGVAGDEELNGWPTPRVLRSKSMAADPLLFERAAFLAPEGLRDNQLVRSYADVTGALPGCLSLRAV